MSRSTTAVPGDELACTHLDTTAKFFRALSDPTRLKLLEYILAGERTSADCVAHAGISQPRVSVHLSCLADCGYIVARRDGKKLRYTVGARAWPNWCCSPGCSRPTTPPP